MRNRYLVCYDIREPGRLATVFKKMNSFGIAVQYSVFLCDLGEKDLIVMKGDLLEIMNTNEDRIMIVNIGKDDGRGSSCIETLGCAFEMKKESSIII